MRIERHENNEPIAALKTFAGFVSALLIGFGCLVADGLADEKRNHAYKLFSHVCAERMQRASERARVSSIKLDEKQVQRQLPDLTLTLGKGREFQATLRCLMQQQRTGTSGHEIVR